MLKSIITIAFLFPLLLTAQEKEPSFPDNLEYIASTNSNSQNIEIQTRTFLKKGAIKETRKGKYKYNLPIFQGNHNSYFTLIIQPKIEATGSGHTVSFYDLRIKNNIFRRSALKLISDDAVWRKNGKPRYIRHEFRKKTTAHMDQLIADLQRALQE